jgi:hypothetical protein
MRPQLLAKVVQVSVEFRVAVAQVGDLTRSGMDGASHPPIARSWRFANRPNVKRDSPDREVHGDTCNNLPRGGGRAGDGNRTGQSAWKGVGSKAHPCWSGKGQADAVPSTCLTRQTRVASTLTRTVARRRECSPGARAAAGSPRSRSTRVLLATTSKASSYSSPPTASRPGGQAHPRRPPS